jgi:hypothetical protein
VGLFGLAVRILDARVFIVPGSSSDYALGVSKTGLLEDLRTLSQQPGNNFPSVLIIDRLLLWHCVRALVPLQLLQDFVSWSDLKPKQLQKYYRFSNTVLNHFKNKYDPKYFFESNWIYSMTRRWQPLIESLGIRHICILKEGIPIPFYYKLLAKHKSVLGSYQGSLIFFINKSYAELHLQLGMVRESQVCVSGMARFDQLLEPERLNLFHQNTATWVSDSKKKILFFVPDFPDFDPSELEAKEMRYFLLDLINKCCLEFIEVARSNPTLDFVIKTKVTKLTSLHVETIIARNSSTLPSNVHVASGGLAKTILSNSNLALGFHSTALLDAISMKIPIASPKSYYNQEVSADFIFDLRDISLIYSNSTELQDLVSRFSSEDQVRGHISSMNRQISETLLRTVGNNDSHASTRILNALESINTDGKA